MGPAWRTTNHKSRAVGPSLEGWRAACRRKSSRRVANTESELSDVEVLAGPVMPFHRACQVLAVR